jgi:hypothetical protein
MHNSLKDIQALIDSDEIKSFVDDAKDTFSLTFNSKTVKSLKNLVHELINAVLLQLLSPSAASLFLSELKQELNSKTKIGDFFTFTLVDLIWLFDIQMADSSEPGAEISNERNLLAELCKSLMVSIHSDNKKQTTNILVGQ